MSVLAEQQPVESESDLAAGEPDEASPAPPELAVIEGGPVATSLTTWQAHAADGTPETAGLSAAASLTAEQIARNPAASDVVTSWAALYQQRVEPFTAALPSASELEQYSSEQLADFATANAALLAQVEDIVALEQAARTLELDDHDPRIGAVNRLVGGIVNHLVKPDAIGLRLLQRIIERRTAVAAE